MKWFSVLLAFICIACNAQYVPPIAMVGYNSANRPILLGVDLTGNLYTSGRTQFSFADTGYIPAVAPEALGIDGLFHFLKVDSQGNLLVSGSSSGFSSPSFKYASQLGCAGGVDLNTGLLANGGTPTEATSCINTALAAATPQTPIVYVDDVGGQLVSGIVCPNAGGCGIIGTGGGIQQIAITAYSITGNVATFTTVGPNNLVANQTVILGSFGTSTFLNGTSVKVISATSTSFTASLTHANASATESGEADSIYGSGFYVKSGANAYGVSTTVTAADVDRTAMPRGAGFIFRDFVINGNRGNGTTGNSNSGDPRGGVNGWLFGLNVANANDVVIDNVLVYNAPTFGIRVTNAGNVKITNSNVAAITPNLPITATNQDGIHISGPANDIAISNVALRVGDDPIAINAPEGSCGPITRVVVSNVTFHQSQTAGRLYGSNSPCTNGTLASVDNVVFTGYVGDSNILGMMIDLEVPSSNTGILTAKISDSIITAPQVAIIFGNVNELNLNNVTWIPTESAAHGMVETAVNSSNINSLSFNNVTIDRPSSSNINVSLLDTQETYWGGQGTIAINRLDINGFKMIDSGGTYSNSPKPLLNFDAHTTIGTLSGAGINYTKIDGTMYNIGLGGQLGIFRKDILSGATTLTGAASDDITINGLSDIAICTTMAYGSTPASFPSSYVAAANKVTIYHTGGSGTVLAAICTQ